MSPAGPFEGFFLHVGAGNNEVLVDGRRRRHVIATILIRTVGDPCPKIDGSVLAKPGSGLTRFCIQGHQPAIAGTEKNRRGGLLVSRPVGGGSPQETGLLQLVGPDQFAGLGL